MIIGESIGGWDTMDIMFFKIALVAYFASTIGYVISVVVRRVIVAKTATWVLSFAFVIHGISILIRWGEMGYSPVVTMYESLSFIAWAVSGVYLAFQVKTKTRVLGAFVSPLAFLLMIVASVRVMENVPLPAILRGYWVSFHVMLSLVGEALFALACCAGIMYLVQDYFIRKKRSFKVSKLLPPLRDLDRINHICILWGFPFLTLGIIAGSVWARTVWGSHWQWDPKQIWTMVTWILYALLLHQRLAIGWKGRKAAVFSIVAFAILIFAVVGVRVFFVTVHSFV